MIVQVAPLPTADRAGIPGDLDLVRLWEAPDRARWLDAHGGGVRVLITHSGAGISAEEQAKMPRLELVANFGVGLDRLPLGALEAAGVAVTFTPDLLTDDVADLALGLMLALLRKIPIGDAFVRRGAWGSEPIPFGRSAGGRKVGILGLGRIGRAFAARAEACRCLIGYHSRTLQPHAPYQAFAAVQDLAAWSDVLVLCVPGGPSTDKLVDRGILAALGQKGLLVNIARGNVVDEPALLEALETGVIAGAGLDVFDNEPAIDARFWALPNIVMTPHVGSATAETRAVMADHVYANVRRFLVGQPLADRLDPRR